jgi:vacuolar-type H+-ATPase subunit H
MVQKLSHTDAGAAAKVPPSDILAKIISKERELEQSIKAAQEQSNQIIQEARDRVTALQVQERQAAESEATALKEDIRSSARAAAQQATLAAGEKLAALRAKPASQVEHTVERLLEMVLPSGR